MCLVLRCVFSFLPLLNNVVTRSVYLLTEPVLRPIRNFVMRYSGGRMMFFDFSPLILMLLIQYVLMNIVSVFVWF